MKKIMLVCAAGMSTSMLVQKMQEAAKERGLEYDIFATSANEADRELSNSMDVGVVLLGPQVRFMLDQYKEKLEGKSIPVSVIDMQDYGMMRGEKVLDHALELMKEEE